MSDCKVLAKLPQTLAHGEDGCRSCPGSVFPGDYTSRGSSDDSGLVRGCGPSSSSSDTARTASSATSPLTQLRELTIFIGLSRYTAIRELHFLV